MEPINKTGNVCKDCLVKSSSVYNLNDEEMEVLCSNSIEIHFQKGEKIIKEGAFAQNIVFIKSGIFKIHQVGPVQRDEILKIDKGPVFAGVSDVFANKIHTYSITALDNTSVCFINYSGYKHLIENNGRFALEVMRILSSDIVDHYNFFVNKIQKQLNAKLADALLYFAEYIYGEDIINIPLTRSELGEFIGTSRESVSKIIHDFTKDKLIEVEGKRIRLLNKDLLRKISQAG
ncbi:MAG: Crp/Fnr family transcriptional regulator [Bacteroidales bacterium]|nr:Crp/Fnr family transcriptional regulator [Bacteroidales bacterium]